MMPPARSVFTRRALPLMMSLCAVAAVVAVLMSAVLVAPGVQDQENARRAARVPELARSGPGLKYALLESRYRGHVVTRVLLAADPDMITAPPLPPGLRRLPAVGSLYASPAVLRLMRHDDTFRRWFPEPLEGEVSSEGLVSPADLIVYVGVDATAMADSEAVIRFGKQQGPNTYAARLRWYQVAGFLLFVVVPGAFCVMVVSRIDAERRRERHRAFIALGAPRWWTTAMASLESGPPVLVGATAGNLLTPVLCRLVRTLPFVHRSYFVQDVRLNTAAATAIVLGLVALAIGASLALTHVPDLSLLSSRRKRAATNLLPALGIASGAVLLVGAGVETLRIWGSRPALVVFGLTLGSLAAFVTRGLARYLPRTAPVSVVIAARTVVRAPGAISRPAALAGVGALAMTAALPLLGALNTGVTWRHLVGSSVLVRAQPLAASTSFDARGDPAAIVVAFAVGLQRDPAPNAPIEGRALVATCDQLAQLLDRRVIGCQSGVLAVEGRAVASGVWFERRADATTVPLPPPAGSIDLQSERVPIDVQYVVTNAPDPVADAAGQLTVAAWARLRSDPGIIDQFQAWTVASGPGYILDVPFADLVTSSTLGLWLALGLIVTTVLGLGAAMLDAATSRQSHDATRALRVAGCSRTQLVSSRALGQATMTATAVIIGVLGGAASNFALTKGGLPPGSPSDYVRILIASAAIGVCVALASAVVSTRSARR